MEPEGVSVSSLDPDDPWNMDTYEKEGDWSPPEAHWSNPQEEWTAPVPVTKPQPTYFVSKIGVSVAVIIVCLGPGFIISVLIFGQIQKLHSRLET